MIFYFSGTGNSRWVADTLGIALGEPVVSIAKELKTGKKEFVCPLRKTRKCCSFTRFTPGGRLFLLPALSLG